MTTRRKRRTSNSENASVGDNPFLGHETKYWSMDAAEYKHVVLGLIFLKYISDAFEEAYAQLGQEIIESVDPEDPDEYRAKNIFWVPPEARWQYLKNQARQPTIGHLVDDAMTRHRAR